MSARPVLLLIIVAMLAVGARSQSVTSLVPCTDPATTPWTRLCWDASLLALRPNRTFTVVNSVVTGPLDVSAAANVAVPVGYELACTGSAPATPAAVSQSLSVSGRLSLVATRLAVGGNLTLRAGAVVRFTETNTSNASIVVAGCLIVDEPNVTLVIELSAGEGNASRPYVLIDVPSGCVMGSALANVSVNTTYVSAAGIGTGLPPTACLQAARGFSALVNMVCHTNSSSSSAGVNAASIDGADIDWPLVWVCVGVIGGLVVLAIAGAAIATRLPRVAAVLFPYRARAYFVPSQPPRLPSRTSI